jgi:hypothetical protein
MRRCPSLVLAALVLALTASGLRPGAAEPSSIGGLVKIVPPESGKETCYARRYDEAHLARHPQQRITRMAFLLRVSSYSTEGRTQPAARLEERVYYQFGLAVQRRGKKRTLRTSGNCAGSDKISCAVDCDGGSVEIAKSGESLLVTLDNERGIQMFSDCDGAKGVWVKAGTDDKVFRVDPAPAEACKALAKDLAP